MDSSTGLHGLRLWISYVLVDELALKDICTYVLCDSKQAFLWLCVSQVCATYITITSIL
jgi:hypothetical protein